jgi:hypothetical protein
MKGSKCNSNKVQEIHIKFCRKHFLKTDNLKTRRGGGRISGVQRGKPALDRIHQRAFVLMVLVYGS